MVLKWNARALANGDDHRDGRLAVGHADALDNAASAVSRGLMAGFERRIDQSASTKRHPYSAMFPRIATLAFATVIAIAPAFAETPVPAATERSVRADFARREASIRAEGFKLLRDGISANTMRIDVKDGKLDLTKIAADLGRKHRIIGLGEATHGTLEIFQAKAEMVRALVLSGSRYLMLEGGAVGLETMDDFICGQLPPEVKVEEVAKTSLFGIWKTQEIFDMFSWLKEFNAKHPQDQVHVFGIDCQSGNLVDILARVKKADGSFDIASAQKKDASYRAMADGWLELAGKTSGEFTAPGPEADAAIAGRFALLAELRTKLSGIDMSPSEHVRVELAMRSLEQQCGLERVLVAASRVVEHQLVVDMQFSDDEFRDTAMASNFVYLEKNVVPKDKGIIIWAHSGHLARKESIDLEMNIPIISMGMAISRWYRDAFHAVDITVGEGWTRVWSNPSLQPGKRIPVAIPTASADSVEGVIRSIGVNYPVFFRSEDIPLRDSALESLSYGATSAVRPKGGLIRGPLDAFDSYIFIPTGKPSILLGGH
jgi:erythromycin esterase